MVASASKSFTLKNLPKPKILQACCISINAPDIRQKFINVLCCSDYCVIYYTNIYFYSVRNLQCDCVHLVSFRAKQKDQISINQFQQKLEGECRTGTDLYASKTVRSLKGIYLQREGWFGELTTRVVFIPYCNFITSKALKVPVSHVIKKKKQTKNEQQQKNLQPKLM